MGVTDDSLLAGMAAGDEQAAAFVRRYQARVFGLVLTIVGVPAVAGHVFLYQGEPSWIMVALTAAPESGDYTMSVVSVDGTRYPAGVCRVTGRSGTVGYPLPMPVAQVAAIELGRPGVRLSARIT